MAKAIKIRPDSRCPCGSGKLVRDCCALPSGHLRKQVPSLIPPPPVTGHAQSGCYLASTRDCSQDLSAEHYISKSVLQLIGNMVAIDGTPWLPHGERREIGINNLTARILCRRHNTSLCALDSEAGQFAKRLLTIVAQLKKRYLSRKRSVTLISGETLELWMLKVACGLFYSKNAAKNGTRLIDDHMIDEQLVLNAFLHGKWKDGCGLFMKAPQGQVITLVNSIGIVPAIHAKEKRVIGAGLKMLGLEFNLIFDPSGVDFGDVAREGWIRRPSELSFENETMMRSIGLTWLPNTPPLSIRMIETVPTNQR